MVEIFPCGKPVNGENLVGREKFVKKIITILHSGQSVMLVSPRRFGKTSILLEVLRRMKKDGYYIGDIDIFDVTDKEELAEKIVITTLVNRAISAEKLIVLAKKGIQKLRNVVKLKYLTQEGFEIILDFAGGTKPDLILDEALDFPNEFSKHHKHPMIFAYDEFSDLDKINGNLIKKMRAKFQRQSNTTYIFSGSQESLMNHLFCDKKSAFYGFSRVLSLPRISERAFEEYIIQTFNKQKIKISKETARCITGKTDCHPYYTQFVCQQIYFRLKGESDVVTVDDVNGSYKKAVDLHRAYFDDIWQRITHASSLQLSICRYLASNGKDSLYSVFDERRQNVYHAINSLIDKGIIVKDDTCYVLIDPLFKDYIYNRGVYLGK